MCFFNKKKLTNLIENMILHILNHNLIKYYANCFFLLYITFEHYTKKKYTCMQKL